MRFGIRSSDSDAIRTRLTIRKLNYSTFPRFRLVHRIRSGPGFSVRIPVESRTRFRISFQDRPQTVGGGADPNLILNSNMNLNTYWYLPGSWWTESESGFESGSRSGNRTGKLVGYRSASDFCNSDRAAFRRNWNNAWSDAACH